ncbi:uncharacterized protein LOC126322539 [Schistocerca gregaria]|uniref:uncharacterized protein LOC126322539 n=1 Tax=Schistocerca gregaria TaxID=7010 RepID=UPI00211DAD72|nr:uncharacterized protein LOC126322539 [Schistocerca gregaria]
MRARLYINAFLYDYHIRQVGLTFMKPSTEKPCFFGADLVNILQCIAVHYEDPPEHAQNYLSVFNVSVVLPSAKLSPLEFFRFCSKSAAEFQIFDTSEKDVSPGFYIVSGRPDLSRKPPDSPETHGNSYIAVMLLSKNAEGKKRSSIVVNPEYNVCYNTAKSRLRGSLNDNFSTSAVYQRKDSAYLTVSTFVLRVAKSNTLPSTWPSYVVPPSPSVLSRLPVRGLSSIQSDSQDYHGLTIFSRAAVDKLNALIQRSFIDSERNALWTKLVNDYLDSSSTMNDEQLHRLLTLFARSPVEIFDSQLPFIFSSWPIDWFKVLSEFLLASGPCRARSLSIDGSKHLLYFDPGYADSLLQLVSSAEEKFEMFVIQREASIAGGSGQRVFGSAYISDLINQICYSLWRSMILKLKDRP